MTKRERLQRAVEAATGQARALRQLVASVPASTMPEAAVVNAVGEVMNTLLTVVSPLAVEVENESVQQSARASGKPRGATKDLAKDDVFVAANKHADKETKEGRKPAGRGWRGELVKILGFEWRVVKRNFPGIDDEIHDHLKNCKPPSR